MNDTFFKLTLFVGVFLYGFICDLLNSEMSYGKQWGMYLREQVTECLTGVSLTEDLKFTPVIIRFRELEPKIFHR